MAKQTINIGSAANDGTGDPLRTVFEKVNANTTELYDGKEPVFEKKTGFNLDIGTAAGTVAEGNDSRLSDARAPTSHNHTLSEITDFSAGDYATAAQGAKADSALQSLPTHSHSKSDITGFSDSDYATAAQGGKADTALQSLPAHDHTLASITDVPSTSPIATQSFWAGTQAAYDALTPDANTLYFIEAD